MATSRRSIGWLALLVIGTAAAVQLAGQSARDRLGGQVAAAARPGDIHMVASVTCTYCAAARAWFEAHRVPFTECLIERDAACAEQYRALLAPGTPVLVVRGTRLVGFDAVAVAEALSSRPR